jgi:hypothetical protein
MPGMCWRSWSSHGVHAGVGAPPARLGKAQQSLAASEIRRLALAHGRASLDLDGSETRPHTDPSLHVFPEFLLGSAVAVEHFLGVIIFHPRLITKDLVVRSFE